MKRLVVIKKVENGKKYIDDFFREDLSELKTELSEQGITPGNDYIFEEYDLPNFSKKDARDFRRPRYPSISSLTIAIFDKMDGDEKEFRKLKKIRDKIKKDVPFPEKR